MWDHIETHGVQKMSTIPCLLSSPNHTTTECFGTHEDCGVKDITPQPIRPVLCEKTNRVSEILSNSVHSQTVRGLKHSKRRECAERLAIVEVSGLNR